MKFAVIAVVWFVAAISLAASGSLQRLRPPAPQLVLVGLTVALLVVWRVNSGFRQWLETMDLRGLIALHLTRFVGLYFLVLCRHGELPSSFAIPAGCGDVLVATLAAVLLVFWKVVVSRRPWIGAWNTFGLIDIVFVVASAGRHGMADPASMSALLRLPLSVLPTFLVPLIIASHIVIFSRLAGERLQR
jgi:hypothetical protein